MSDQLPLTVEHYLRQPAASHAWRDRLALVESTLSEEALLPGESPARAVAAPAAVPAGAAHAAGDQTTASFLHETIKMAMATRAAQVGQLRRLLKPRGLVFPLTPRPGSLWATISVGRAAENHLRLRDPAISLRHAQFELDRPGRPCLLTDLGSSNGSYVNGQRLQPHEPTEIAVADCVRFGQAIFYVLTADFFADVLAGLRP